MNDELEFSWSPDGQRIAVASDRAGNFDVWVIDVNSGETTQLTHHPADDRQPSWSPDGQTIAFLSFRDALPEDERGEIYVMQPDGSGERRLTNNQVDRAGQKWTPWLNGEEHDLGVWSPDSRRFATQINDGITIFALDGSAPHTIVPMTPAPRRRDGGPVTDRVIDWSSDGRRLLLHSNRGGQPTDDWVMYILDLETEQMTRLVRQVGMQLRFSPDGTRIVFTDKRNDSDDVFLIDPDGSNQIDVTGNGCNALDVRWSPDGSQISYGTVCGGFRLFVMQADGTQPIGFFPFQDWQTHHHEWAPQP
jgi:Tol biopolymer transport system component